VVTTVIVGRSSCKVSYFMCDCNRLDSARRACWL